MPIFAVKGVFHVQSYLGYTVVFHLPRGRYLSTPPKRIASGWKNRGKWTCTKLQSLWSRLAFLYHWRHGRNLPQFTPFVQMKSIPQPSHIPLFREGGNRAGDQVSGYYIRPTMKQSGYQPSYHLHPGGDGYGRLWLEFAHCSPRTASPWSTALPQSTLLDSNRTEPGVIHTKGSKVWKERTIPFPRFKTELIIGRLRMQSSMLPKDPSLRLPSTHHRASPGGQSSIERVLYTVWRSWISCSGSMGPPTAYRRS
jgi:hypothetical protein